MAQDVEAGRELNAMVAERVMGWRVIHYFGALEGDGFNPRGTNYYIAPDGEKRCDLVGDWKGWHPSTDISAALEVVEKLKADDFWPSMNWKSGVFIDDWNRAVWFVRFRCVRGGTRGDHWHADESLPLAICFAALKVVERSQQPGARAPGEGEK